MTFPVKYCDGTTNEVRHALGPVDPTKLHTFRQHCTSALTIDVAMSELVTFHLTPEATLQLGLDYRHICATAASACAKANLIPTMHAVTRLC